MCASYTWAYYNTVIWMECGIVHSVDSDINFNEAGVCDDNDDDNDGAVRRRRRSHHRGISGFLLVCLLMVACWLAGSLAGCGLLVVRFNHKHAAP